jgi:hypothetical protein
MRARFWISTVTRRVGSPVDGKPTIYGDVELNAVQRSTDDNVAWAHYTPVGKLTMTVHPEAREWFEANQGKDVFVDITPVE